MKPLYTITFSLLFCWTLNIEEEQEVAEKKIEYEIEKVCDDCMCGNHI